MPSDVQLEALVQRSACAPHVVKHCSAFYTARPIYTSEGLFQKTVRHLHHQGEELIWNHTADDRLYLFPIASWISSFVLEWCLPFRTTPFVWAPSSFDEHIISFFHRHILSYLSSESHKKHPPGLAGEKEKVCTTLVSLFLIFPPVTWHIVHSPITNSKWRSRFRHSGQICKIWGYWVSSCAKVICKYNGSGLLIQSKGSI